MRPFENRADAGAQLGAELERYRRAPGLLVLGLPRGGVPVAAEVARILDAPLDVFLVRKLGVPAFPELALGAISSGGAVVLNEDVVEAYDIPREVIERVAVEERLELERREALYRHGRAPLDVRERTVIIVDDGLATGASMRAAATALRALGPRRLVVAVPVGAAETCEDLRSLADAVVCLRKPDPFQAVGLWYRDFSQTTDREVVELLAAG